MRIRRGVADLWTGRMPRAPDNPRVSSWLACAPPLVFAGIVVAAAFALAPLTPTTNERAKDRASAPTFSLARDGTNGGRFAGSRELLALALATRAPVLTTQEPTPGAAPDAEADIEIRPARMFERLAATPPPMAGPRSRVALLVSADPAGVPRSDIQARFAAFEAPAVPVGIVARGVAPASRRLRLSGAPQIAPLRVPHARFARPQRPPRAHQPVRLAHVITRRAAPSLPTPAAAHAINSAKALRMPSVAPAISAPPSDIISPPTAPALVAARAATRPLHPDLARIDARLRATRLLARQLRATGAPRVGLTPFMVPMRATFDVAANVADRAPPPPTLAGRANAAMIAPKPLIAPARLARPDAIATDAPRPSLTGPTPAAARMLATAAPAMAMLNRPSLLPAPRTSMFQPARPQFGQLPVYQRGSCVASGPLDTFDGQVEQRPASPLRDDAFGRALARAAFAQTTQMVVYSARYVSLKYPLGDLSDFYGACSDVIVRAYRALGYDLQAEIQKARVGVGDKNIDHRRTNTLRKLFSKSGASLPITQFPENYKPGDIVTYYRPFSRVSRAHIAIVSNRLAPTGRPYIIHNRGYGVQLEDALFVDKITGHYRFRPYDHLPPGVGEATPMAKSRAGQFVASNELDGLRTQQRGKDGTIALKPAYMLGRN